VGDHAPVPELLFAVGDTVENVCGLKTRATHLSNATHWL